MMKSYDFGNGARTAMPFRSSKFIDFDTGESPMPPMVFKDTLTKPWLVDQKIDLFECMVDVWQLGVAAAMLREIDGHQPPSVWSHAAYGLVSVTFTYFEMVGTSLNPNSGLKTAGEDFNHGFCDVYPAFKPANSIYADKLPVASGPWPDNPDIQKAREFRDRIRNGMYHLGYTKSGVEIHNDKPYTADFEIQTRPDPKNPGQNIDVYRVNPHYLVRTLVDHFPGFVARLRDTANTGLRQKFGSCPFYAQGFAACKV